MNAKDDGEAQNMKQKESWTEVQKNLKALNEDQLTDFLIQRLSQVDGFYGGCLTKNKKLKDKHNTHKIYQRNARYALSNFATSSSFERCLKDKPHSIAFLT